MVHGLLLDVNGGLELDMGGSWEFDVIVHHGVVQLVGDDRVLPDVVVIEVVEHGRVVGTELVPETRKPGFTNYLPRGGNRKQFDSFYLRPASLFFLAGGGMGA